MMTIPAWKSGMLYLRWQLQRAWEALTVADLLILSSLALWLGVALWINQPLSAQLAATEQQLASMQQTQKKPSRSVAAGAPHLDMGRDFLDFLPAQDEREAQLQQLHVLARERGIVLSRIDYRSESAKAIEVQRLALRLSVQGGYGQQRQFLHEMLAKMPNLAIERITLEKVAGLPDGMNAILDVSLYFHQPSRQVRPL